MICVEHFAALDVDPVVLVLQLLSQRGLVRGRSQILEGGFSSQACGIKHETQRTADVRAWLLSAHSFASDLSWSFFW